MSGRRTSDDQEWKAVKERVSKRDRRVCRLVRVVTPAEMMTLRKNAGPFLQRLDPAHIMPVGAHVDLCYLDSNLVLLNHYSHSNLDNMLSPLDGRPISREERDKWWRRIAGEAQWLQLMRDLSATYDRTRADRQKDEAD